MTKKILAILLSTLMLISMPFSVSAMEYDTALSTPEVFPTSESVASEGIMPCSTISGYYSGTITASNPAIAIPVTSSGTGGTGITVQTSCSSGTYELLLDIYEYGGTLGNIQFINDTSISTNGTYYYHDLIHHSPNVIYLYFNNLKSSMNVTVWVYG